MAALLNQLASIALPKRTDSMFEDIKQLYMLNGKHRICAHVQNVAAVIDKIAIQFTLDRDACAVAAYCHDCASVIRAQDMLSCARKQGMEIDPAEEKHPFLLHQRFSALLAAWLFQVEDARVISAITHHTTLKANPSPYDMALFVADKLAWDQDGQPPFLEAVQNGLEQSLAHASLAYMDYIADHQMILYPHAWFTQARRWLAEELGRNK